MNLFSFATVALALGSGEMMPAPVRRTELFSHQPPHLTKEVSPTRSCPHGFELVFHGHKHTCQKVHVVDLKRSCPHGFTRSNHICFKKIFTEPHVECPHGFHRQGHVCLDRKVEHPAISCPKGFALKHGECRRQLHFGKIRKVPPIFTCRHGFTLKSGKCLKTIKVAVIKTCPHGLKLELGKCTDVQTTKLISTCPRGFQRVTVGHRTLCQKVEKVPPTVTCPHGAVLTPDHKCLVHKRPRTFHKRPHQQFIQKGYCVTRDGKDQNSGVIKLYSSHNGNTDAGKKQCYAKCRAANYPVKKGCEIVWDQGNRGCYLHTKNVAYGNGVDRHSCWIFGKDEIHF